MPILVLARHGNTFEDGETPRFVGCRSDLGLTAKGEEQAALIGQFLHKSRFAPQRIVSGSLIRQHSTAELIAGAIRFTKEIEIDIALNEIDYGAWEGKSSAEIEKGWPEQYRAWSERREWPSNIFPQSEAAFRSKIRDWLQKILADQGGDLVSVTSNGVLHVINSLLMEKYSTLPLIPPKVQTGHICIVAFGAGNYEVIAWNIDPASVPQTNGNILEKAMLEKKAES